MKKQVNYQKKVILLFAILALVFPTSAQRMFSAKDAVGESAFEISIHNIVQKTDRSVEFDLYLRDMDASQDFELATIQAGILINSSFINGGSVSLRLIQGYSTLNPLQAPEKIEFVNELDCLPGFSLIRIASRSAVGQGNGTILSKKRSGDCVARINLSSSVPFAVKYKPDLIFTSNAATLPFYPTRVAQYISKINVQLRVTPGSNAIVYNNNTLYPAVKPNDVSSVKNGTSPSASNILSEIRVYSYQKTVIIENPSALTGEVSIFDIGGKEIKHQLITGDSRMLISLITSGGSYIVKIKSPEGNISSKVFIY